MHLNNSSLPFTLQHIPCGQAVPPGNPHAITVSLPTLSDVIGYEEKHPHIMRNLQSGYPRFFTNGLVSRATEVLSSQLNLQPNLCFVPVSSRTAFFGISRILSGTEYQIIEGEFPGIIIRNDSPNFQRLKTYLQNTGFIPSSRQAEDFLIKTGELEIPYPEERAPLYSAEKTIIAQLAEAYSVTFPDSILLACNGMNAIQAVVQAITNELCSKQKKKILQFGWLYLDTMALLHNTDNCTTIINCQDFEEIEKYITGNYQSIAAVVTELPTNPLLQVPDIPRLSKILRQYDIPLIVDSSCGTGWCFNLSPYADIIIESLTKFACGHADSMMGAIVFPENSLVFSLRKKVRQFVSAPHFSDVQRVAHTIQSYKQRVMISSQTANNFIEYCNSIPGIAKVFYADIRGIYDKSFMKYTPPICSVVFQKPLAQVYERLHIVKGPSFGTQFTLGMAYVYLAHYDLLQTPAGRTRLNEAGLDEGLLRVSIGTEPIDDLVRVFNAAL
ncbi:MAG: PLP-dependent transferase [Ignavibacteria bacterium]|nr:PLP-dependent transferase [Ignavibacteria bacterium]